MMRFLTNKYSLFILAFPFMSPEFSKWNGQFRFTKDKKRITLNTLKQQLKPVSGRSSTIYQAFLH